MMRTLSVPALGTRPSGTPSTCGVLEPAGINSAENQLAALFQSELVAPVQVLAAPRLAEELAQNVMTDTTEAPKFIRRNFEQLLLGFMVGFWKDPMVLTPWDLEARSSGKHRNGFLVHSNLRMPLIRPIQQVKMACNFSQSDSEKDAPSSTLQRK
jgi:hypothetical protein